MGYLYILLCEKNRFYVGSTTDLERRIRQHKNGEGANFTKKYKPQKLVYHECFPTIGMAFRREKQIQNWSRKKKDALIESQKEELKRASKKRF